MLLKKTFNKILFNYKFTSINHKANMMNLTDSFGRSHNYLRISLVERCNLRCQYCMPENGIKLTPSNQLLTTDEVKHLAKIFVKNLMINKIRLTGGEPLLRKDLIEIITYLNELREDGLKLITMTTNATVLKRKCSALKEAGLDGVNISLDSLIAQKFEFISRRENSFKSVMNGILSALEQQFKLPVKINVVVMKGFNDDEIINFIEFTKDKPIDVRFIEYMPFDSNKWSNKKLLPYEEILKIIKQHYGNDLERILEQNKFNLTSKPYKIRNYKGQIADGNLKVCLFDQNEISLRDELRRSNSNDSDLIQLIKTSLLKKKAKHSVNSNTINKSELKNQNKKSSPELTHLSNGQLNMVDVSYKNDTKRIAKSQIKIELGKELFELIKLNQVQKGDLLTTAKIAGIQAAKKTSNLIPLCHQLNLNKIDVQIELNEDDYSAIVISTVELIGKTGVEMESLVCSAISALTIYDMGKSANKAIKITDLKLIYKEKSPL